MIVPAEFEQSYDRLYPLLSSVQSRAEQLLRGIANAVDGRFGGSRIKPSESLYLKLEKEGASTSLFDVDDLVAGTIVIPNKSRLQQVETLLGEAFDQTTPIPIKTFRPEMFIYDDRHLIVRLKQDIFNLNFQETLINVEVQVKTELQAASSVVTRELSYKPAVMSWSKARLAGQLRALVEVADSLLTAIESDDSAEDGQSYFATKNALLKELEQSFAANELPADRRRFAGIIEVMQKDCRPPVHTTELGALLRDVKHKAVREAQSLSIIQKVFLMLLADGKLANLEELPLRLGGKRSYFITEVMEVLCPAARLVPQNRRLQITAAHLLAVPSAPDDIG